MLSMLERLCAQLIETEVSGIAGVEKDAHNSSRSDCRCGYRPPAVGYPHGNDVPHGAKAFATERKRSEAALMQVIQEAFVGYVHPEDKKASPQSKGWRIHWLSIAPFEIEDFSISCRRADRIYGLYPFTAPATIPLTMFFWKMR